MYVPLPHHAYLVHAASPSAATPGHLAAPASEFSEISYPGTTTLTHVSHLLRILPRKQRNPCAFSSSLVLIPAGFVAVSAAPNVCQMSQARCSKGASDYRLEILGRHQACT